MPNIYASLTLIASQNPEFVKDYVFTDPTPNLYAAMSNPGSCMAMVHREESLNATLNANSEGSASYTFSSDIDFLGPVYVVIRAPILVNQCSINVNNVGAASVAGKKRFIIPGESDRPGSMVESGGTLKDHIIAEDTNLHVLDINFGSQGAGFHNSGKAPLDQNEGDDYSSYYNDYSAARFIRSASLTMSDETILSTVTHDALVAVNELFRSNSSKYHNTLGHFRWSQSSSGNTTSYDETMRRELKLRALRSQTWIVELPFFMDVTGLRRPFPAALLRHRTATSDVRHPLKLEIVFSPLSELICNGSSNVGGKSSIVCDKDASSASVNTVTLPHNQVSDSSPAAHYAMLNTKQSFEPKHFSVSLIVTEIIADAESMQEFVAQGPYKMVYSRFSTLSTGSAKHNAPAEIDLSKLARPLSSLIWFPRLQMDEYRMHWYRMRGMLDQLTGRTSRAIVKNTLSVEDFKFADSEGALLDKVVPSRFACRVPEFKEIYMYSFATLNPFEVGSESMSRILPGSVNMGVVKKASLRCEANSNVFTDNTGSDGINPSSSYGGSPAVHITVLAVEHSVLSFDGPNVRLLI